MRSIAFIRCLIVAVVGFSACAALAKEIVISRDDLKLNAELKLADGKTLSDGAVIITHGALAHNGMELIATLQNLLTENGYNTLAINLGLGQDNRHGFYDCKITHRHRNDDAVHDIGAWVKWLEKQGSKSIVLLGHSRGGAQTALYAAGQDLPTIKSVVLLAAATAGNTDPAAYQRRYGAALDPVLKKARKMVQEGKGGEVIKNAGLMSCRDTSVTAAAFVSYYGQPDRLDTPSLLPRIKKPTLVIVGSDDKVVIDLDKKIKKHGPGKNVQTTTIDGAGHFFRDLYADDVLEAIDAFLKKTGSLH